MKGYSYRMNIDYLELCFVGSRSVVDELENTAYHDLGEFRISAIESTDTRDRLLGIDIRYSTEPESPLEWVRFAVMRISNTFQTEEESYRYVWMKIDNKAFYTRFNHDTNILSFVYYIADSLSLQINNFTRIDLALDSTLNYFQRIRKAVRSAELLPLVLGKAYPDKKTIIPPLQYLHTGDRERYRTNTLNLSTSEKDLALCIYNKTEELQESHKEYIAEWNGINKTIWRSEVRIKRKALNDFLESANIDTEYLYYHLGDYELLLRLYAFFADRLLRFRKGRGESLSFWEV